MRRFLLVMTIRYLCGCLMWSRKIRSLPFLSMGSVILIYIRCRCCVFVLFVFIMFLMSNVLRVSWVRPFLCIQVCVVHFVLIISFLVLGSVLWWSLRFRMKPCSVRINSRPLVCRRAHVMCVVNVCLPIVVSNTFGIY